MFYDRFKQLADEKGLSVHRATQNIGLSKSTATKWKKTGATPSGETLSRIAEYFDVSVDYLLTGEKEKPSASSEAEGDNLVTNSENRKKGRAIARLESEGDKITPEQDEMLYDIINTFIKKNESGGK